MEEQPWPKLPVGRYRLVFTARETVRLPDYSGSTWRGAFGRALKRTVCATRLPACEPCPLLYSCVYPYIFETPLAPGARKMRLYPHAPHPFVLEPGQSPRTPLAPDEPVALGLNLFGHANRSLAYIVHALSQAGAGGLGKGKGKLDLAEVWQEERAGWGWRRIYSLGEALDPLAAGIPEPPACPARVTVRLLTPLRIQHEGDNVGPAAFRFADFFGSLLRRISLLTYFHSDEPLETDFAGLTQKAQTIPIAASALHWHDWRRYSSRQRRTMELGGLVGSFVLEGKGLDPFWPYLWLGQWTHAGKATSMGLGGYRIEATSLPNATAFPATVSLGREDKVGA